MKISKTISLISFITLLIVFGFTSQGSSNGVGGPCDDAESHGVCAGSGETCKIKKGNWPSISCGKDKDGPAISIEL